MRCAAPLLRVGQLPVAASRGTAAVWPLLCCGLLCEVLPLQVLDELQLDGFELLWRDHGLELLHPNTRR